MKLTAAKKAKTFVGITLSITVFAILGVTKTYAAPDTDFTQNITAGTLTTDIRDASRVAVANPSVVMSSRPFSFDCQTGGNASAGTFGTNTQRIYVDNPAAAAVENGWTLTLAAASPTDLWTSGGNTYDFNDAGSSGCGDGADPDSKGGQMTVDPSVSTITNDCTSCTTTNINKGSSNAFVEGTTNQITLVNSTNTGFWRGYVTGVTMSQTIPAEQQAANNYAINLALTVTAN